jgi:hypothetical protein
LCPILGDFPLFNIFRQFWPILGDFAQFWAIFPLFLTLFWSFIICRRKWQLTQNKIWAGNTTDETDSGRAKLKSDFFCNRFRYQKLSHQKFLENLIRWRVVILKIIARFNAAAISN